ncbi:hypothetical protein N7490_008292 [Penicillium lividum]|nr:hypothetical protein N7490_008292 [Penicillium lividum]
MMQLFELSSTSLSRDVAVESPESRGSWSDELPSTDILDLCLDLYFSHAQNLLPFVHPPCFKACETPSVLVFPMCLIGYMILDRKSASKLIHAYLAAAIRQCRADIASQHLRTCPASDLLIVLASAVLLLNVAACTSDFAYEEQRQELYEEAVLLARERGLFDHRQYNLTVIQSLSDDVSWKAWARVQSAERLIAALIITDSYSAQILGTSPILRPENISIPVLCPDILFSHQSLVKWKAFLGASGNLTLFQSVPYDINRPPDGLSGFGLQIFLSCIWLDILTSRHRISTEARCPPQHQALALTLLELLSADTKSQSLGPGLVQAFKAYGHELANGNSNSILLWNLLCIQMTTNLPVIEDAAGRSGPEAAKAAVDSLRIWADSPRARRAFLHSTQTYLLITQHRNSDVIMLHSEMAFFTAALVMGFYLLTAPVFESPDRPPLDVFEELDWEKMGGEGMDSHSSSFEPSLPVLPASSGSASSTPLVPRPSTPSMQSMSAIEFIRHGGPVSFRQAQYTSYGAARRSFMNFAAQLEEVGKWNTREYCEVLRILSDTLPGCFESSSDLERRSH